jgi:hypothetical protein
MAVIDLAGGPREQCATFGKKQPGGLYRGQ